MDERLLALYIPVQQAIINYWMGEIPLIQSAILLYVNERTLRYGKAGEHINRSHFLDAVRDKQKRVLHNGINIAHSPLWRHVANLEKSELLQIEHLPRNRRGNIYRIELRAVMAPVSEGKLQTSSKSRQRGRRRRRLNVSKSTEKGPL